MARRLSTLAIAFAPAIALLAGLPFVNRLEPFVLGLPLLLCWFAGWVLVTPVFLGLAYLVHEPPSAPAGDGAGE
jgi:hypothetical protein